MKLKKIINQYGFTLVEVLVAGSILAGLSIAGLKLMENQTKSTNIITVQNEEERLVGLIHAILSNENACTSTFKDKFINNTGALLTDSPSNYSEASVTSITHETPSGPQQMFPMKDPTVSATDASVVRFGPKGLVILNYILEQEATSLKKSFNLASQSTSRLKFAVLRVYIDRDITGRKNVGGGKTMMKKIPLVVTTKTVAGFQIASCRASGGMETAWSIDTATNKDLYFDKGTISVGTGKATTITATSAKLQVYGGMEVKGSLNVKDKADIPYLKVKDKLSIPVGPPGSPKKGTIWIRP